MTRHWDWQRAVAGLVFAGVGGFFILRAQHYAMGNPTRVGPGGFPLLLGSILLVLGIAHLLTSRTGEAASASPRVSWRVVLLIPLSGLAFGLAVDRLGLVPAIVISTAIGCAANRQVRIVETAVLCLVLAAFGAGVFVYGLGLPFTLFATVW
jgi:hypothetical protein